MSAYAVIFGMGVCAGMLLYMLLEALIYRCRAANQSNPSDK